MALSSVGHRGEEARGSFLLLADAGEKGSAWAGWQGQGVTRGGDGWGLGFSAGLWTPVGKREGKGGTLRLESTFPSDELQRRINHCRAAAAKHVTLAN